MKGLNSLDIRDTENGRWISIATANRVISSSLMEELSGVLRDPGSGLPTILTSSGERFFSPGLDLNQVGSLNRGGMESFMRSFQKLCLQIFSYPAPVIAALNGHALGGGCILAACCDFRIAATSARIGLTELNLDLPLPYPSQRIIEHLLGYAVTRRMVYQGLAYPAAEALELGWVDEVVEASDLAPVAEQWASELRQTSPRAFRISKKGLKQRLADELHLRLDSDISEFLDSWFSPEVQERLSQT